MNLHTTLVSKTWNVQVDLDEHDDMTRATARLETDGQAVRTATGTAYLNPADRNVPGIGDELATARALEQLAHDLLLAASVDVSQSCHEPVALLH